jgi:hypothetical protein
MRPFQAKEALTRMGICNVSDGGIVADVHPSNDDSETTG